MIEQCTNQNALTPSSFSTVCAAWKRPWYLAVEHLCRLYETINISLVSQMLPA